MNASVCMATYNGQRFLREQINSILLQLQKDDELIIIDDASLDATHEIINAFTDARIHYQRNNQQLGHVQTFSLAMAQAQKDIIVLADQDDLWTENRLHTLKAAFTNCPAHVIAGNFTYINENGKSLPIPPLSLQLKDSEKNVSNVVNIFLGRRPYYGCAMAFRRNFNAAILPIPAWVESHDLWIAMAGNLHKSMLHIEEYLLLKREHSENVSTKKRRHFGKIIISRLAMLKSLIILSLRKH